MLRNNNRSAPAKKDCTDPLSEEGTDGLAKPPYVIQERAEGILIRRLKI
jgi:hypothetical protein